jgi:hypothetical protein
LVDLACGHLLEEGSLERHLEGKLLTSDVIYLLVLAEKIQAAEAPGGQCKRYYAEPFLRATYHRAIKAGDA